MSSETESSTVITHSTESGPIVENQNINYFCSSPDEILLEIFSYVPKHKWYLLAQVCRRFAKICCDKRLYKHVCLKNEVDVKFFEFKQLLTGSWRIEEIDITSAWVTTDGRAVDEWDPEFYVPLKKLNLTNLKGFRDVVEKVLDLCRPKQLILDHANFTPYLADTISENRELELLSMEFVNFSESNGHTVSLSNTFYNTEFKFMFRKCSKLTELNMSYTCLNPKQFSILCKYIPKSVEKLFLNHISVPNLSHYGDLLRLFNRVKNIKHLGITAGRSGLRSRDPGTVFSLIVNNLENLEYYNFCSCDLVTCLNMICKLTSQSKLKRIYFRLDCPYFEQISSGPENFENHLNELVSRLNRYHGIAARLTNPKKSECVLDVVR